MIWNINKLFSLSMLHCLMQLDSLYIIQSTDIYNCVYINLLDNSYNIYYHQNFRLPK